MKNNSTDRIKELTAKYPAEKYDELIRGDDAEVFYHLSSLRHTLFSWYPFAGYERALVLGDQCGALASGLTERFAHTDILLSNQDDTTVIKNRFSNRSDLSIIYTYPRESYDCIMYMQRDVKEDPSNVLPELQHLLKEDGVLLAGLINSSGIRHLYDGTPGDGYDRDTYRKILENAGFPYIRPYYPLPSLRFIQEVFTDDDSPEMLLSERLSMSADEKERLYRAAEEGLFPAMADHLLWECRKTPGPMITHVYLTAERQKEHSFATVVYTDHVTKQFLCPEGINSLRKQQENLAQLQACGIRTVQSEYRENKLYMPRVQVPLLADLLADSTGEQIISYLEQLYREILRSSVHNTRNGEIYLQKGYIDMIPANCFISDHTYIFFDQEFTRDNCPADFIMYRAIRYTWQKYPRLNTVLTQEDAYKHFQINEQKQRAYAQEENVFTSTLRQTDLYPQIFQTQREKTEADTEKHRRVQAAELDLLKVFDQVCAENGLRYCAVFGTLLGAVRHHGMIPWDDDIDLAMPREDYDKLIMIAPQVFKKPYFLQTPENDPECFYGGYMKLRNTETTAAEWFNKGKKCCQGIWIDIFPLDHCGDEISQKKQQRLVYFFQRLLYAKRYPLWAGRLIDSDPKKLSLYYILASCRKDRKLCQDLKKACTKHRYSDTLTIFAVYYSWRGNHNRFPAEDLKHLIRIPFEDMMIPVPENYDAWLKQRYGSTYMAMPAETERHPHHAAEYDPDHAR